MKKGCKPDPVCFLEIQFPFFSPRDFKCSVFAFWDFLFYSHLLCIVHICAKRNSCSDDMKRWKWRISLTDILPQFPIAMHFQLCSY